MLSETGVLVFPNYDIIKEQMNHVRKMLTLKFDTYRLVSIDNDIYDSSHHKQMSAWFCQW